MPDTLSAPFPRRWRFDPGPYAAQIDAYRSHLFSLDYRPWTVRGYEHAARHFCRWLHMSDGHLAEVGETDVDRFRGHDCRCAGPRGAALRHARNTSTECDGFCGFWLIAV